MRWSQKAQDMASAAPITDRPALLQKPGGQHRPKDVNNGNWERSNLPWPSVGRITPRSRRQPDAMGEKDARRSQGPG